MSDGAFQGITAGRALKTILGGEEESTDDEKMSPEAFAEWIRGCPDDAISYGDDGDVAYSGASRLIARYMLQAMMANPSRAWSLSSNAAADDVYAVAKSAAPPEARWAFDGCSGFMVGWAFNAARRCMGFGPAPNPAIVTIETTEGG